MALREVAAILGVQVEGGEALERLDGSINKLKAGFEALSHAFVGSEIVKGGDQGRERDQRYR